jgi:hypothetical protein
MERVAAALAAEGRAPGARATEDAELAAAAAEGFVAGFILSWPVQSFRRCLVYLINDYVYKIY